MTNSAALTWEDDSDLRLFFASRDCSGPAYTTALRLSFGTVPAFMNTTDGAATLTMAKHLDADKATLLAHSFQSNGACFRHTENVGPAWVTDPPIDLSSTYTPPFHVR